MKIHLFDLKSEMQREGITMLDFLENNFQVFYNDPNLQITKIFFLEEYHLCRPDLISWEAYYNPNYSDILMKFNQISNPFSMNVGDFILAPNLSAAVRYYREDKLRASKIINDTKALFIDPKKASQKDLARLKQLEKIAAKRGGGATEIKPTNLLRNNEVPFETDGTSITFAPSMSTTQQLSQVVNNK
jgi:hypothetical protein